MTDPSIAHTICFNCHLEVYRTADGEWSHDPDDPTVIRCPEPSDNDSR